MTRTKAALYLLEIAALAVVYHLAARLGLQMAYVQQNTSPVWPPSGFIIPPQFFVIIASPLRLSWAWMAAGA